MTVLENGKNWVKDANGNRCSVERFGSEEAAKKALDSLEDCKNCSDCSHCSRCSRCSDCSDCSGCSGCSDCSDCSRCSRCSGCSRCSDCSDCSDCSRCSRCSGCSRCSDCSHIYGKRNLAPGTVLEPLVIPSIPNIHKRLYEAVSQPNALSMATWHTCGTTHCRGGWIVNLAGELGKKVEDFFGTELAAMLIYDASGYQINPCRFYDGDAEAMADMKRLAEK